MNELISTQDGSHSILSQRFGVSYHSRYGAIQESRHVFIQAGLYFKLLQSKSLRILEMGLGTGLNAFLVLLESQEKEANIYYEAIEAYPLTSEEAKELNYPVCLGANAVSSLLFEQLHTIPWEQAHQLTPRFSFKKNKIKIEDYSPQVPESFDLIFYDAFSPTTQPELWEPDIWHTLYKALAPGGVLVTYCAKGIVKRSLRNAGFIVESLPGPPGKREMTRAIKAG